MKLLMAYSKFAGFNYMDTGGVYRMYKRFGEELSNDDIIKESLALLNDRIDQGDTLLIFDCTPEILNQLILCENISEAVFHKAYIETHKGMFNVLKDLSLFQYVVTCFDMKRIKEK